MEEGMILDSPNSANNKNQSNQSNQTTLPQPPPEIEPRTIMENSTTANSNQIPPTPTSNNRHPNSSSYSIQSQNETNTISVALSTIANNSLALQSKVRILEFELNQCRNSESRLFNENETLQKKLDERKCLNCKQRERDVLLVPCGHVLSCSQCIQSKPIGNEIKI